MFCSALQNIQIIHISNHLYRSSLKVPVTALQTHMLSVINQQVFTFLCTVVGILSTVSVYGWQETRIGAKPVLLPAAYVPLNLYHSQCMHAPFVNYRIIKRPIQLLSIAKCQCQVHTFERMLTIFIEQ